MLFQHSKSHHLDGKRWQGNNTTRLSEQSNSLVELVVYWSSDRTRETWVWVGELCNNGIGQCGGGGVLLLEILLDLGSDADEVDDSGVESWLVRLDVAEEGDDLGLEVDDGRRDGERVVAVQGGGGLSGRGAAVDGLAKIVGLGLDLEDFEASGEVALLEGVEGVVESGDLALDGVDRGDDGGSGAGDRTGQSEWQQSAEDER